MAVGLKGSLHRTSTSSAPVAVTLTTVGGEVSRMIGPA
jgi:hypothetical protein